MGTPAASDVKELGDELPRIAEVKLKAKKDGKWVLAEVKNGDGGEAELWLRPGGKGRWSRLSRLEDRAVEGEFGEGPDLFLLSRKDAPRGRCCASRSRLRPRTHSGPRRWWCPRGRTRS